MSERKRIGTIASHNGAQVRKRLRYFGPGFYRCLSCGRISAVPFLSCIEGCKHCGKRRLKAYYGKVTSLKEILPKTRKTITT